MPIKVLMPALSPTMTEGKLAKWVVKEGDTVESGDVMAEIETDKATMEVEAVDEGKIGKILVAEGTDGVAVNAVIALLLEDGEDASALDGADTSSGGGAAPKQEEQEAEAKSPPADDKKPEKTPEKSDDKSDDKQSAGPATKTDDGDRIFASPLARRIAKQEGLDLAQISGSGPHGRIVQRDVEDALASGTGKAKPASKDAPAGAPKTSEAAAAVPACSACCRNTIPYPTQACAKPSPSA